MPLSFLNGQFPDYSGLIFQTATQLIDNIQTLLETAGWLTYFKTEEGLGLTMSAISDNGHSCHIEFFVTDYTTVTNGKYLNVRAWHEATKVTGSPLDVHRFIFVDNRINRLWITADEDAGCIAVFGATGSMNGVHFGFLDRVDPTDEWAWMIGYINAQTGYNFAYVAKSKHNNTNWRRLSLDYGSTHGSYNSAEFDWENMYPATCVDMTMRGDARSRSSLDGNGVNAFYNPYAGRLNYDGRALIDRYSYIEGRGSMTNYNPGSYHQLSFRGFVKHAYCGVASLGTAAQVTDPFTGFRIMSVGGTYTQGMRIA